MKNKLKTLYTQYDSQLKKGGLLFLAFVIVKSLVFFAPLAISYLLSNVEEYGRFEYSLNLGQTFISIFSMGLGSSLAYFTLKKNAHHLAPAFHLHFFIISIILLLITVCFPVLRGNLVFGGFILGASLSQQIFNSSVLKLADKNIQSVVADSMLYFLMAVYAAVIYFKVIRFDLADWHTIVLIHLVLSNFIGVRKIKGFRNVSLQEFKSIYSYGLLTVVGGFCLFALSNNTRLLIEHYTSFSEVGIYSYYFRIGTWVIVLYRVIGIMMFKKYFVSEHRKIDTFFSALIGGLFFMNLFSYLILWKAQEYYPALLKPIYTQHIRIYLLVLFQISFWIGIALFESIINRELLIKQMIVIMVPCLLLLVGTLQLLDRYGTLTLKSIIMVNSAFILAGNLGQLFILKRKVYFYKKTLFVQLAIAFLFAVYLLFFQ
jgi:O-antigen/teichoic acid export membrane protein